MAHFINQSLSSHFQASAYYNRLSLLSSLFFSNSVVLGGHIVNISKTIFPKLIF